MTVADPTLLQHQLVDVVDAIIVAEVVANTILNVDGLVEHAVVAVVNVFDLFAQIALVDVVVPFFAVDVVEVMVVASLSAIQV